MPLDPESPVHSGESAFDEDILFRSGNESEDGSGGGTYGGSRYDSEDDDGDYLFMTQTRKGTILPNHTGSVTGVQTTMDRVGNRGLNLSDNKSNDAREVTRRSKHDVPEAISITDGPPEHDLIHDLKNYNDTDLCGRCRAMDLAACFGTRPSINTEGLLVYDLGRLNRWSTQTCKLCDFLELMRWPQTRENDADDYCLCVYSMLSTYFRVRYYGGIHRTIDTVGVAVRRIDMRSVRGPLICCTTSKAEDTQSRVRCQLVQPNKVDIASLRQWLDVCSNHHPECCLQGPRFMPLRVIDCRKRKVVLSALCPGKYVALSYTWGSGRSSKTGKQGYTGSAETKKAQMPGGVEAEWDLPARLPQTIEDAVSLTLRTGHGLLWVDQYCIDQTSHAEKRAEIEHMDQIYASAALTIIAAAGLDSNYGLPGVGKRNRVPQPTISVNGHTFASSLTNPADLVRRSRWMSRGWTFQEAQLSPRKLFLTDEQAFFECRRVQLREVLQWPAHTSHGEVNSPAIMLSRSKLFPRMEYTKLFPIYRQMVQEYSSRQITFQSDALNAFHGVLKALQSLRTDFCHVQAIGWSNVNSSLDTFRRSLAWRSRNSSCKRRPQFPSWSWLGWEGGVRFESDDKFWNSWGVPSISVEVEGQGLIPIENYVRKDHDTQTQESAPKFVYLDTSCSSIHLTRRLNDTVAPEPYDPELPFCCDILDQAGFDRGLAQVDVSDTHIAESGISASLTALHLGSLATSISEYQILLIVVNDEHANAYRRIGYARVPILGSNNHPPADLQKKRYRVG